jgi:hypothetical protein
MERKDELEGLKNFCKNTKVVITELYTMVQNAGYEHKIEDCNWRFGDMSVMLDEIIELVDKEMKS